MDRTLHHQKGEPAFDTFSQQVRQSPRVDADSQTEQLETSDPAEITPEWIDSELGSLAATSAEQSAGLAAAESQGASANASGTSTPKPESEVKFARPARPGRRR